MGRAVGGAAGPRLLRVAGGVALGLALIATVAFVVGHLGLTSRHAGVDEAAAQAKPDVVRLRWRPDELRPAPSAGHICVTDATHGRICASFVAGERPADGLKHEIERRGLVVHGTLTGR
jgi:hypothetical protein